jgi:hypothetical protein
MKKKPTPNKAEKHAEQDYFTQKEHKDKEKRKLTASLYKEKRIPKSRKEPHSR